VPSIEHGTEGEEDLAIWIRSYRAIFEQDFTCGAAGRRQVDTSQRVVCEALRIQPPSEADRNPA